MAKGITYIAQDLCVVAQAIEFNLFEEAFEIYKKFGKKVNAIQVLLNNLQDLDRAHEYANKVGLCSGWLFRHHSWGREGMMRGIVMHLQMLHSVVRVCQPGIGLLQPEDCCMDLQHLLGEDRPLQTTATLVLASSCSSTISHDLRWIPCCTPCRWMRLRCGASWVMPTWQLARCLMPLQHTSAAMTVASMQKSLKHARVSTDHQVAAGSADMSLSS